MKLIKRYVLPLAGVAALAAGAVAVQAATPTPAGGTNPAQVFVGKLAAILHLSPTQLKDDFKQAELQTIDQMVKDGKLTQAQADALKQKINSGDGLGLGFLHEGGKRELMGGLGRDLMTAEIDAAAKALKTTPDQLKSDIRGGKTLTQLEQSAGITDSALRTALVNAAKGVLDPAVKAGTITQAQEDRMVQAIQSGAFGFLGPRMHGPRGHGFFGGPRDGGAAPGANPTDFQQS